MIQSRQLAAIMFTDIVGYTAIMQADEQKAVGMIKHYNAMLEEAVLQYDGRVLNFYGDGSLCIFSSATDAVNCSIQLQKTLRTQPTVPLRVGLHIGEVFFEKEKAIGDGVNVASRIQSLGQENSILVSAEIYDKVKNNNRVTAVSLGFFHFKNVNKPIEVFALSNDGLLVPSRKKMQGKLKDRNPIKQITIGVVGILLLLLAVFFGYKNFFSKRVAAGIEKSIAVLPFTDMSQNKDQEFFSDGLTEDIITQLAKIKSLRVTSRTSVMQFKKSEKSIKQIAEALGANIILEGSVQHSGNQVRITAQLINASNDESIWAESYDRSMQDIFAIQSDIALQISNALKAKLTKEEQQLIGKKYTQNSEAYQLYLRGRYYWNQRLEEPLRKGIGYFREAIAKDSSYALAYAGLGDSYLMLGVYSYETPEKSMPLAKKYIEKALQLDGTLAEAYSTLIDLNIHYYWDFVAAENYFRKAIDIDPQYANAWHWYGELLICTKQFDKSYLQSEQALLYDPYSLVINTQLGTNHIFAGQYQKAITQLNKTIELDSGNGLAHSRAGLAWLGLKQYEKALKFFRKGVELAPGKASSLAALGYSEGISGNTLEAKKIETQLLQLSANKYVSAEDLAVISLGVGKKQQALQYLNMAVRERNPFVPFLSMNPIFFSLKDDPVFQHILKQITPLKDMKN